jgi:hypothetical protein
LINTHFRNSAKPVFDLTGAVPEAEAIAREMGANEEQVRTIKEMFQVLKDV